MLFASSSSYLQANRLVLSTASKRMLLQQATIAKTSVGLNVRSFTCGSMLHYAQHGHAATTGPQESLYDAVKKRFPMEESVLKKRFDQLKRNHSKFFN